MNSKNNQQIGKITKKVIDILDLNYNQEIPIFIGPSNINHIKEFHPDDFEKYGLKIKDIISNPTYLARNQKKKSIEFIKRFYSNGDFVLVAVRVSNKGTHFVRTMYVMSNEKVKKYHKHNYFYKF